MPTGLYSYYIKHRWDAGNGWINWNFVRLDKLGYTTVNTHLQATPFRTHDEAEEAAFNLTIRDPGLIGLLSVEGKAV